ncbi:MAG: hypothetical protein A3F46_03240 [Legionellales bacterium RIFCSPHIGHO2_12_FULL_42_9]|nr:MAG: hypothetical protein A3F46_03240 [Legionellales bacterium RIFCSPHIGHO2_12_FULL_42_9]
MKHLFMKLSLIGVVVLNSACAPINTQFSCNATAGDRCLSIEEVNAMTEVDEVKHPVHLQRASSPNHARLARTQTIWMAPWTDEKGIRHTNDTLFASTQGVRHVG